MAGARPELTAERLREVLHYDPATGWFIWLKRLKRNGGWPGTMAGHVCKRRGYRVIGIDGKTYLASRLAYLWMRGVWPPEEMDHIDRNRCHDTWINLRPATRLQNAANTNHPRSAHYGLPRGVYPRGSRFWSQIRHQGRHAHLGTYDTPELASLAYQNAALQLHGEFAAVN